MKKEDKKLENMTIISGFVLSVLVGIIERSIFKAQVGFLLVAIFLILVKIGKRCCKK